jgi:hypothetical protein
MCYKYVLGFVLSISCFSVASAQPSRLKESEETRSADRNVVASPFPVELYDQNYHVSSSERRDVMVRFIYEIWKDKCNILNIGNVVSWDNPNVIYGVTCLNNKKTNKKGWDYAFVYERRKPTMTLFGSPRAMRLLKCFDPTASYDRNTLPCNSLGRPI